MMEYIYNLYVFNESELHKHFNDEINKSMPHTIITFYTIDQLKKQTYGDECDKKISKLYNFNVNVSDIESTTVEIFYKLEMIYKLIDEGLLNGIVCLSCPDPNQLSSMIVCLYILNKTKLNIKLILSGMRKKNPYMFKDDLKYKKLLEKVILNRS